jgi:uncharacterized membrane protein
MGSRLFMLVAFVLTALFPLLLVTGSVFQSEDVAHAGLCALLFAACASVLGFMWSAIFEIE